LTLVVDSSVLVAITLPELEAEHFSWVVERAESAFVGWPTLLETWTVLAGRLSPERADIAIDSFVSERQLIPVAFGSEHYSLARQVYQRFRLAGHPAKLNYGDVMSYALARTLDVPLLFKGADFGLTDVKVHPASVLA
jgi:ribonuclease VapC